MFKTRRRNVLVSIILVIGLIFSLAGCGGEVETASIEAPPTAALADAFKAALEEESLHEEAIEEPAPKVSEDPVSEEPEPISIIEEPSSEEPVSEEHEVEAIPIPIVIPSVEPEPEPEPEPAPKVSEAPKASSKAEPKYEPENAEEDEGTDYILNKNTKKFHDPYCKSVKQMKEKNKKYFTGSRSEVISMGYDPCKNCDP